MHAFFKAFSLLWWAILAQPSHMLIWTLKNGLYQWRGGAGITPPPRIAITPLLRIFTEQMGRISGKVFLVRSPLEILGGTSLQQKA